MTHSKLSSLRVSPVREARIRLHCGIALGMLPAMMLAVPGTASAANAVNTARIAAPAGAIEANTGNNEATDTDTVFAAIAATPDSATGINGASGNSNVLNVFTGDTLNGLAATSSNATLSVAPGSTVPPQLSFNPATGVVGVNPGTPAGTYSFDYQICETLNPTNCRTATVSITVDPSPIVATNDTATGINGASGATAVANAFTSDSINGVAASPSNAVLSLQSGTSVPAGLTFNTATGNVDVAPGTPAGSYVVNYTICEALNPTNCRNATITVEVVAAPVSAAPDTVTGINGATGNPSVLNVFGGDTINGAPATSGNATLSVAPGSTVPPQLSFNPATGAVGVNPGTPAGTYSFDYQICETLNPTNCRTATVSITVAPSPIVATNDTATGINGASGATAVANAFTSDTISGVAASPSNAVLSLQSGTSVPAGLTFNTATGSVDVAPGTPAGSYVINYTICEVLNPTNCRNATITVEVVASPITIAPDNATGVNGATGNPNVLNVFGGDTINGAPATSGNATLSVAPGSTVPPQLSFNPATGVVGVNPGTPAGTYSFDYQICETLNPTNCRTATVSITVAPSPIVATNDTATGINGASGATAVANAFTSDTINGVAASPSNAVLSVQSGTSVPAGLTFNTATGSVDVAPGTPAGSYVINYTICEALNPTNCRNATITVEVLASAVVATGDSVTGINGVTGNGNALNLLTGDTINGAPATSGNATLSVAPGSSLPPQLSFNPATGVVGVNPGTPAGTYSFDYQICETLNPTNCRTATASVTVAPSVDLVMAKTNGTSIVVSGTTTTYTLTITNNGPDSAVGAVVTDVPGAGITCPATNPVTIAGSGVPAGSFTIANLTGAGITLGTLGNGQSTTITYSCQVN